MLCSQRSHERAKNFAPGAGRDSRRMAGGSCRFAAHGFQRATTFLDRPA